MTDFKPIIERELNTLRLADLARGEKFAAIAYSKVLAKLKTIPSIYTIDDAAPAVGKGKIRAKVEEIIANGFLAAAQEARSTTNVAAYEELLNVYGIGPKKAQALIDAGCKGVAHLRELAMTDLGLLNDKQVIGLQYYEEILQRIPRAEMEEHERFIRRYLGPDMTAEMVGSYRRGAADSGDIDVILTMPTRIPIGERYSAFKRLAIRLKDAGYLIEELAEGITKNLSIVRLPGATTARRLDLLIVSEEEFPFAVLYFTGSDKLNVAMRGHANSLCYTMNEHGMTKIHPDVPAVPVMRTEADIFAFLGLKYMEPTERNTDRLHLIGEAEPSKAPPTLKVKRVRVRAAPAE
jgi:DNA polymerase beta